MEHDKKINICLACDDNYARHAGVVIASILANSMQEERLSFFILEGNLSEASKQNLLSLKTIKHCEIKFISVNEDYFEDYKKIKTHGYITLATYYRLKLPTLIPNIDKIIYFDCDFVVNSSLSPIYDTDLEGCPIAGVQDINKKMVANNPTYVNAGMLLFDINKMRELDLEAKFLNYAKENQCTISCGDQEIINEVCKGQIKILDEEWNVQSSNFTNRSSYTKSPKCIHFVAKHKPWHFGSYSYHRNYYFKYLQLTPWKIEGAEKFKWIYLNQLHSLVSYFCYRPLFIFRPRFWKAVFYTYIKPFQGGHL